MSLESLTQGSDATNSKIWQESSLLSTHWSTLYIPNADDPEACLKKFGFADLQRVLWKSANGTRSLLDKQLKSVGIPTPWVPAAAPAAPLAAAAPAAAAAVSSSILRMYLYTADGGPDQVGYKKQMRCLVAPMPHTFWFDFDCVFHGAQLAVRSGLKVADAWCTRQGCRAG